MMGNIEQAWNALLAVLLAMAGGLARMLNRKDTRSLKLRKLLSELFIAAVCGILIYFLSDTSPGASVGLTGSMVPVASALAGWGGPRFINWLEEKVTNRVEKKG